MSSPTLFLGSGGGRLLRADRGDDDAGATITYRDESNPLAPAGASGECLFERLRIVATWEGEAALHIVPILDGIDRSVISVTLPLAETRRTDRFRIALSLPHIRGGVERGRRGMRGTWLAVRVLIDGPALVILESVELEHRVLRDARRSENAGGET